MDTASFQRTALTTELAQLQRRTLTTELAELERRTLTTELAELDSTALHTELEQLQETALKKAASSLEPLPAHSSFEARNLATLVETRHKTAWLQGGVLSSQLLTSSLTLYQLDLLDAFMVQAYLPELLDKGSFSPLSLAELQIQFARSEVNIH